MCRRSAGDCRPVQALIGSGSLAVGASYVPGTYVLPAVLSGFSQRYPHLSLTLTIRPAPVIQEMLLAHEIDIGVLSAEPFSWAPLIGETLCEDELVCIFSPQHRLASSELLYPEQLQGVPFILHGQASSTRSMTLKWAKDLGIALQRAWRWIRWRRSKKRFCRAKASRSFRARRLCRRWSEASC
ncbi:hypothetical protein D7M11_15755 [Paenibacillus ginsengarvi]|uniref:LysR substrate-binding domain-containing protein n=1 Tax=Paenibacillus ginsengarvi TaxID=400777 RepID=A0A3B0CGR1_9BACL|nr:hypothetical protein D7M11_15755 [Paenibacillus ginsengarvi]